MVHNEKRSLASMLSKVSVILTDKLNYNFKQLYMQLTVALVLCRGVFSQCRKSSRTQA